MNMTEDVISKEMSDILTKLRTKIAATNVKIKHKKNKLFFSYGA